LPLLTRNFFHAIGSYDNGVFMVHKVYICSDLNPHSIMQQYDHVESNNNTNPIMSSFSTSVLKKQVHFQEGEHCYLPKISSTMTVKPRMVCFLGENNEIMHMFTVSDVYIQMSLWPPPFMMMGRQGCGATLKMTLSRVRLKCKKRRMMRTSIAWVQPHHYGAILRHISNTVISFLCFFVNYLENELLPNDLIIVRNHGDDEEDERDNKRAPERQGDANIKVEIQSNSEFQSLTSSPTRSPEPPRLQIDVHDAYQIRFGHSTYAKKEDEITFPMELVPGPTKIELDQTY
jgi:hypothetical protein